MSKDKGGAEIPLEVFKAFRLELEGIERIRRLYKIYSTNGIFALKPVEPSSEKLFFAHRVIEYLRRRGFFGAVPYEKTIFGEPIYIKDGTGYVLTKWVEGRELNFDRTGDLLAAAGAMGELHRLGEGFSPGKGQWTRSLLGRWLSLWARAIEEMRLCARLEPYLEQLIQQAESALTLLSLNGDYHSQVQRAELKGNICHRDLVSHNFIQDYLGNVHIIDFEYCALEIPAADIGRFLRKALPQQGWDWSLAKDILRTYEESYPLMAGGKQMLLAYLTFPHEWWRLARRFSYHTGEPEHLEKVLTTLIAQDGDRKAFLQEMSGEFMRNGRIES
ncbi:MAG TPA: CotS family spore coat protein [Bacillota bacterium]|nr:CotS family spore coat protein [Bacillota bacterium]